MFLFSDTSRTKDNVSLSHFSYKCKTQNTLFIHLEKNIPLQQDVCVYVSCLAVPDSL